MKKVSLGNTGFDVSALCFGAMRLGTREDQQASYALLDRYVEAGGSFIDTANIYAHWEAGGAGGDSETLLGKWLADRGNREEVFLAGKVGFGYADVAGGLRAEQILTECDKTLQRLGTDYIDLYYAHCDDRSTPLRDSMEAYHKLLDSGKIRCVGGSNFTAWRLAEANCVCRQNDWEGFCCLQQRFTYLRPRHGTGFLPQRAVTEDLLEYCPERKVTLLAYSPLLSGAYVRDDREIPEQYRSADSDARLKVLAEVASETGATANQVILAWMMQSRPAIIPVFSAGSIDQLDEDLGACDVQLTDEQVRRLWDAGEPA
jgi:aryl-alcohol dehydrogenase-like predicted oxidoreductase